MMEDGFNTELADTFGSIDAFAKITIPLKSRSQLSVTHTSRIIDNNFDPTWNFCFVQSEVDIHRNIEIEIWDHDSVLSNDKVCTASIAMTGLITSPVYKKEYTLVPLGNFKPYRRQSSSTITISMGICSSFETVVDRVNLHWYDVKVDAAKCCLVYPIGDNIFMKIVMKKHVKISLWDCNQERNSLNYFKADGKDLKFDVYHYETPKNKMDLIIYREIKLKKQLKLFKELIPLIQLVTSPFTMIEQIPVSEITKRHGWKGILNFNEAMNTLSDAVGDEKAESIYMIEQYYFVKFDWDSDNSDQRVGLLNTVDSEGFHLEISHKDKTKHSQKYFGQAQPLLDTEYSVNLMSEVNDLPYPVKHNDLTITLMKQTEPQTFSLLDLAPIL